MPACPACQRASVKGHSDTDEPAGKAGMKPGDPFWQLPFQLPHCRPRHCSACDLISSCEGAMSSNPPGPTSVHSGTPSAQQPTVGSFWTVARSFRDINKVNATLLRATLTPIMGPKYGTSTKGVSLEMSSLCVSCSRYIMSEPKRRFTA